MSGKSFVELRTEVVDPSKVPESLLGRVAKITLQRISPSICYGVSILITNDETLQRLNRVFAGYDEVTDVLAFPATVTAGEDGGIEATVNFPAHDAEVPILGDIAIALPQAIRQARNRGYTIERELAMLTAHGILHLFGYDHAKQDDRKIMFGETEAIVSLALGNS